MGGLYDAFRLEAKFSDASEEQKIIAELLKELHSTDVLVGIPEENSARNPDGSRPDGGPVDNVDLLYIHSNGSPLQGIPARPVLEPAMSANAERLGEMLDKAADAAMDGSADGMRRALESAGMAGQNAARAWFTDPRNGWAPNAPETVRRKGSSRPLIDTGELRKSITYVVRKK